MLKGLTPAVAALQPPRTVRPVSLIGAVCMLLPLLIGVSTASAQQAVLQGIVTDAETSAPLEGASVVLERGGQVVAGAITDRNGFYLLRGVTPDTYTARFTLIGHEPGEYVLNLGAGTLTHSVELAPAPLELEGVTVTLTEGAARRDLGRQLITPTMMGIPPTPAGSGDLAMYLQTMPGVITTGDRGGQLFVRGGSHTENLALVDGLLIYQPFHILGFFSAFPEDLVAAADFYAGGFGARYNGRTSSVLDVRMRDGSRSGYRTAGSLSPFVADVLVEGPLTDDGDISWLASARRSVLEETSGWLLGQEQPIGFASQYLKVTTFDEEGSRCSGSVLRTSDSGRMDPEDEVSRVGWQNLVAGGRCTHLSDGSLRLVEASAGYSSVRNEAVSRGASELFSTARRYQLDVNTTTLLGGGIPLEAGTYLRLEEMSYQLGEFFGVQESSSYLWSTGGYAEVAIRIGDRVLIPPGLVVPLLGPSGVAPRLRTSWLPFGSPDQEITGSLGYYRQSVGGTSDTRDAGSVFIFWSRVPDEAAMRSIHAQLGWEQTLRPGLEWSIEGYHRNISNVSVPLWSTEASFNTELALADGTVWGADLRMEYNRPRFYAFFGYGYSRTQYEAAQDHFSIWFGEPVQRYHPPHDRRHQVNAMLNTTIGGFELGARWLFGTGLPFTRPMGYDETFDFRFTVPCVVLGSGRTRLVVDRPYSARLPLIHRLDVSAERAFDLPIGTLRVQLGAINAYDRTNMFYYDIHTHRRLDQFPLAPYASLRLETR